TRELISKILKKDIPKWLRWCMKWYHLIFILLLVVFLFLTFLASGTTFGPITGTIIIIYGLLIKYFNSLKKRDNAKKLVDAPNDASSIITDLPVYENFELQVSDPDDGKIPAAPNNVQGSGKDSIEAERFRKAAVEFNMLLAVTSQKEISKEKEERNPFKIAVAHEKVAKAINPAFSYTKYLQAHVRFPVDFTFITPDKIVPAMAYPDFEEPMYAKLRDISVDLLIPNINLVPDNTISLLISNQPFIESYMVGLNHEMGRELLWREYPSESRGSYFRQFWDVNGIIGIKDDETDEAAMKEKYKDIKPIHTWNSLSELGSHNNRDAEGDETQIVLMIKGELFKHYPNTVLFAQKAHKKESNSEEKEIRLELSDEEIKKEIKFPLYKAEINPDIKFFGFDLTAGQASGADKTPGFEDNEGWFFIIQQAPGEPRFGMDIDIGTNNGSPTWDDLSWKHFNNEKMKFIDLTESPSLVASDDTPEGRWGSSSAQMAYVLYQKPVMIAVHGTEMLEGF
ncbi:MAG TPA: hypothetical protein VE912_03840, partial [Bacteroidales bacterium]|nr:hypothetical protein [Bacteroidales bacterium]